MIALYISLGAALLLGILFVFASYYAYRVAFWADRTKKRDPYSGIDKRGYKPYEPKLRALIDNIISLPYESVEICARDGTRLFARYYHACDGAPLEIQCHGYRSTSLRDFAGSGIAYKERPYNLLLIDQRSHGESGGKVITFGIKERFDILDWIKYGIDRFGQDVKILLYGISMGGATVLMAAGEKLPENVRCVIADSPYSSPLDIIAKVGAEKGFPRLLVKPLAICGARLFGGFSLTSASPREAVARASVPILILHGDADSFVPDYMSDEIAAQNPAVILKKFAGADHAASYLADTEGYLSLVDGFVDEHVKE